jgi:hypothetical protein
MVLESKLPGTAADFSWQHGNNRLEQPMGPGYFSIALVGPG